MKSQLDPTAMSHEALKVANRIMKARKNQRRAKEKRARNETEILAERNREKYKLAKHKKNSRVVAVLLCAKMKKQS